MPRLPRKALSARLRRLVPPIVFGLCLLAVFPALASADVETMNFDGEAPNSKTPIEESAGHRIRFPKGLGFRPYQTDVGGRAKTGSFVGDLTRCPEEAEATGAEPESCLSFRARTTAVLAQTAKSVKAFAGRLGPPLPGEEEFAVLTAFDAEGVAVATTGLLPVTETFNRRLEVTSAANDIASFTVEARARTGPAGAFQDGQDLGIDELSVEFVQGGSPDFLVIDKPQVLALVQGQSVDVPVQVSRLNGSSGQIELSVEGLPTGVSASSPIVSGNQPTATATIVLSADRTASDTNFVPVEVKVVGRPLEASAGAKSRLAPLSFRVAQDFALSASGVSETEPVKVAVPTPDCGPAEVPVAISRDIAMSRDVTLSVRDEEGGGGLPTGVSAEFLPSAVVPPGGNLVAQRTLRLRANPSSGLGQHPIPLLLEGRDDLTSPPRLLQLSMTHVSGATVATGGPGLTPRFGREGSLVRVHGLGFCPGTSVEAGNNRAIAPATLVDDHTIEFHVPRYATTGRITIIPPAGTFQPYKTDERLVVDSFRNTDGFQFHNYPFGTLGFDELNEAFGPDDIFVSVNPCWPFGDCSVRTGVVDPIAAIDWGWMSLALRGTAGHCLGINLAAQDLKSGKVRYDRFEDPPANRAFEIPSREGPDDFLDSFLDAEHAKQYSNEYLSAWFGRDGSLKNQLGVLEREFSRGREPMIQLEQIVQLPPVDVHGPPLHKTFGHAVLAYDMAQGPEGTEIYVYDNEHPFLENEDANPELHREEVQLGIIRIDKDKTSWRFPVHDGREEWTGKGNDGSFWTVPVDTVPSDSSLPGVKTLGAALSSLSIGSTDGSVQARKASPGAEFLPTSEPSAVRDSDGIWVTDDLRRPLRASLEGVRSGHYNQAYTAPGFVATASDVRTGKGVTDVIEGSGDSLSFESGSARPLKLELARRSGAAMTRAATLETHASAHGSDTAGFAGDGALTYAHDGAPATLRFTLTTLRRQGGPSRFVSGPVAVGRGDRLRIRALDRDLDRVRLTVRDARGRSRTRVLRNHDHAPGHLKLGAPRISKHRLSLRFKLSGTHGGAVVGAALRLARGSRILARKAVALKKVNGARVLTWRIPRRVKAGRYRLLADLRAVTGGAGSTPIGSVSAHRASQVAVRR